MVFTFLSPLLTDITGVPPKTVNIGLLLFGGATVVGNFAGGRLNDVVGTRKAMMILLWGLIVSFVLIRLAVHSEIAIFTVLAIWGVFAFAIPPVMQAGVVATAEQVAPDVLATASGFNIAAFNLGIAGRFFIGSQLLKGPGLLTTPYASIAMAGHRAVDRDFCASPTAGNRRSESHVGSGAAGGGRALRPHRNYGPSEIARGRPVLYEGGHGKGAPQIGLRLPPAELASVDAWIR